MKNIYKKASILFFIIALTMLCTQAFAEPVISKKNLVLSVGKKETIKVNGLAKKQRVTSWKSSNNKIATVSNGKITAKSGGTATITATVDKKTKLSAVVKVNAVSINKKSVSLGHGQTVTLSLNGLVSGDKVSWSSSNKKVASVSSGGVVRGIKNGTATVTGKCNGKSYKCKVTVSVKLSASSISLFPDDTYDLQLIGKDGVSYIEWRSSNTKVATVTGWGQVYAKSPGKVTVSAKYKGKTYKCSVTVKGYDYPMTSQENAVYKKLIAFKRKYPEGTRYDDTRLYGNPFIYYVGAKKTKIREARGCMAFALELTEAAFGDKVTRAFMNNGNIASSIRVGDILRTYGGNVNGHSVIVLKVSKSGRHAILAEANYNRTVHWEREVSFDIINKEIQYVFTRW